DHRDDGAVRPRALRYPPPLILGATRDQIEGCRRLEYLEVVDRSDRLGVVEGGQPQLHPPNLNDVCGGPGALCVGVRLHPVNGSSSSSGRPSPATDRASATRTTRACASSSVCSVVTSGPLAEIMPRASTSRRSRAADWISSRCSSTQSTGTDPATCCHAASA